MAEACPAYPWQQDGAQRGQKMFMSGGGPGGNCASCHQGMFSAPVAVARGEVPGLALQATEIAFTVAEEAQPAAGEPARAPRGGAYTPDLTTLAAKIQERQLYNNVYFTSGTVGAAVPRMLGEGIAMCQDLKKKMVLPSLAWLQFAQPYIGTSMQA